MPGFAGRKSPMIFFVKLGNFFVTGRDEVWLSLSSFRETVSIRRFLPAPHSLEKVDP
jgi:hypothetical protein